MRGDALKVINNQESDKATAWPGYVRPPCVVAPDFFVVWLGHPKLKDDERCGRLAPPSDRPHGPPSPEGRQRQSCEAHAGALALDLIEANQALAAKPLARGEHDDRSVRAAGAPPARLGDYLVSKRDVLAITNVTFPTIWAWMRAGKFPRARVVGGKSMWLNTDIEAWLATLPVRKLKGDTPEALAKTLGGVGSASRARLMTYAAPSYALTWGSAGERNKRLMPWRRAVSMTFAEQPRCLRVAWALDHLFNAKTGYAYPLNKQLANMTGLPINKIQEALLALESDGAIVRRSIVRPNGQPQRVIYAATALLPNAEGGGATPLGGGGGATPVGRGGGSPPASGGP